MKNLDFLLEDKNILEAEIAEIMTENGNKTVGLSLVVGMDTKQVSDLIELVGESNASKILTAFEILLTKEDLKKISVLVKDF